MIKKLLVITTVVVIGMISLYVAYRVTRSRELSPPENETFSYGGLDVSVDYHRPSKRGRVIFGDSTTGALQPNGRYWRLGANEATEISFSKDVTFAGQPLSAGRYRMYAIPNELTWTISLNSELGAWGYNKPDYSLDVVSVGVIVERTQSVTEKFTITFDADSAGINMHLMWDQAHVRIPIDVSP